jgi:ubiquinone/menaquinone biosynthesis C-methylase UbiE
MIFQDIGKQGERMTGKTVAESKREKDNEVTMLPMTGCCGSQPSSAETIPPDGIREQVEQFYAQRAVNSDSCCADGYQEALYSPEMLSTLPDNLTNFSLGCGDPITMAELKSGETVLDLGSGGGLDCFLAAKMVGETGRVIGIDMTPEMLERARNSAQKLGFDNIEFRKGYLEDLPVEDGSVNVIISNCVINLSPDKPQVFGEMYRALKPGGRISVSDIVSKGELPDNVKNDMAAWGACIAGALEMDEFIGGLRAAGFVEISLIPRSEEETSIVQVPPNTLFSAGITARKP